MAGPIPAVVLATMLALGLLAWRRLISPARFAQALGGIAVGALAGAAVVGGGLHG